MKLNRCISVCLSLFAVSVVSAQDLWHGLQRQLRYKPDGTDFVITNGNRRFTRALYGTHTAFRVEAGDLPEFALYMPGMGGNISFVLKNSNGIKKLIHADSVVARYRAGCMLYDITDGLLGKGKLEIAILAMADQEGAIIKVHAKNISVPVQLICIYGGATGKKFSRDGDMGPDPENSFYLKPEYTADNRYTLNDNQFALHFGSGVPIKQELPQTASIREQVVQGVFPVGSQSMIVNVVKTDSLPLLHHAPETNTPAAASFTQVKNDAVYYFAFYKPVSTALLQYEALAKVFNDAELYRKRLSGHIIVKTPDKYINTIGGALSMAADAIWESPSYMHGAIGWRMRLNGWRGPYTADVLGWHDRARQHFSSYALSQVTDPVSGIVVADTALNLARHEEKMGNALFSSGYISRNPGGDKRPHHYDMNLVYIDALLWHIRWTGDTAFIRKIWPVIKLHLAWEKRNFDSDDDGLYDAYASIWASDALQYSGGAVTHSSAYNYRANRMAAEIAVVLGEDGTAYKKEADRIMNAIHNTLWMPSKGVYAEYKDAFLLHDVPALWTVYHAIDSDVPDAFKAYQLLKYTDDHIPHIPVQADGLTGDFHTLSTSNWMPYTWSLNNVALAELMHTSLANWQSGRKEEAFLLWKSALIESMYLGGSPGNFQQISTYDAIRGEAYRDFADPVAMTARSLVQGLFGILPDVLNRKIMVRPGLPSAWNYAEIKTPDIKMSFVRQGKKDKYTVSHSLGRNLQLQLLLNPLYESVASVKVNGKTSAWKNVDSAVALPIIEINAGMAPVYNIEIVWAGKVIDTAKLQYKFVKNTNYSLQVPGMLSVYDPQQAFSSVNKIKNSTGPKLLFVQVKQGLLKWWRPVHVDIVDAVSIAAETGQPADSLVFSIHNNTRTAITGDLFINNESFPGIRNIKVKEDGSSRLTIASGDLLLNGSNNVSFRWNSGTAEINIINWKIKPSVKNTYEPVAISSYYNDKVTQIFKNRYLSPRPKTPTLQLPVQGIGDWTHPNLTAVINDSGFRKLAAQDDTIQLYDDMVFMVPSDTMQNNIAFTSRWDNYPGSVIVPLSGNAKHVYLLMAGSTHPMQSRIVNGIVAVSYTDGSRDTLELRNPENWWPIEQDYYRDGFAFNTGAAYPIRIHLKTGRVVSDRDGSAALFNGKWIDGGAATILDMPLDKRKTLQSLSLQTISGDVVIGLMGVTLLR